MDIIAGFLHKRVIEMTGLELLEVFSMALNRDVAQTSDKIYYVGHSGIRAILGELNLKCSHSKAQKIKNSGICNEAIEQQITGGNYKIDVGMFKELFLQRRKQFNF